MVSTTFRCVVNIAETFRKSKSGRRWYELPGNAVVSPLWLLCRKQLINYSCIGLKAE